MKIGKPPSTHLHHGVGKPTKHHKGHHSVGPQRDRPVRGKKVEQENALFEADDVDLMAPMQGAGEANQGGTSDQQQQQHQQQQSRLATPEPRADATTSDVSLHSLVAAVVSQLDELAAELQTAESVQLTASGELAPSWKRAKTTSALRDILRQVLSGDFGLQLTQDPNASLGRLFAGVKEWPRQIPPGKRLPWTESEWDEFITWLNQPPPMPPRDELL